MSTIYKTESFKIEHCFNCGVPFCITTELQERRLRDHKTFYCPNGHGQVYTGETKAQKLARKVARLESEMDQKNARIERIERSRSAMKGQVTKIKNRVAAGVCPCCNRTFQNLARHMKGQHPQYQDEKTNGQKTN